MKKCLILFFIIFIVFNKIIIIIVNTTINFIKIFNRSLKSSLIYPIFPSLYKYSIEFSYISCPILKFNKSSLDNSLSSFFWLLLLSVQILLKFHLYKNNDYHLFPHLLLNILYTYFLFLLF